MSYMTILQHYDMVGTSHSTHSVSDDQHRLALEQTGESFLHGALVLHIQAGGGFIQKDHRRVF